MATSVIWAACASAAVTDPPSAKTAATANTTRTFMASPSVVRRLCSRVRAARNALARAFRSGLRGVLATSADQPEPQPLGHRAGSAADVELQIDVAEVRPDGGPAHRQLLSNRRRGEVVGGELQHVTFARRQVQQWDVGGP